MAFSTARGAAEYFDLDASDDREGAIKLLRELFDNGLIEKSVHDLKRALALATDLDIHLENVTDDTLLQAYLLDPERSRYELTTLVREYIGTESTSASELPPAEALSHTTSESADFTGQLGDVLAKRLEFFHHVVVLMYAPTTCKRWRAS